MYWQCIPQFKKQIKYYFILQDLANYILNCTKFNINEQMRSNLKPICNLLIFKLNTFDVYSRKYFTFFVDQQYDTETIVLYKYKINYKHDREYTTDSSIWLRKVKV